MRRYFKYLTVLIALVLSGVVYSNLDKIIRAPGLVLGLGTDADVSIKVDRTASDPFILWNEANSRWEFSNDGTSTNPIGAGTTGTNKGIHYNILQDENTEFEDDVAGWTEGTAPAAHETTAAEVAFGSGALSWNPSAADTLVGTAVSNPDGLDGASCLLRAFIKDGDSNYYLQVYNGTSVLAETQLQTYATYTEVRIPYICEDSANTVTARLEVKDAVDAALIRMDKVYIGENFTIGNVDPGSILIGKIKYAGTVGCIADYTNHSTIPLDILSAAAACPAPTIQYEEPGYTIDPADRENIDLQMIDLPVGKYLIKAKTNVYAGATTNGSCALRIGDGTTYGDGSFMYNNGNINHGSFMSMSYFYEQTTEGTVRFRFNGEEQQATHCAIYNDNSHSLTLGMLETSWEIWRLDSPTETVVFPEAQGFFIQTRIGGTQMNIGGDTNYSTPNVNGLDMIIDTGAKWSPEITCAGTEEASGPTCAGNEEVGIEFTAPVAGRYEVCGMFTHYVVTATQDIMRVTWQFMETPVNSQAISQRGAGIVTSGGQTENIGVGPTNEHYAAVKTCGTFQFDSSGRKAVRLMRAGSESDSPPANQIWMNRAGGFEGDRETTLTVRMLTPFHNPGLVVQTNRGFAATTMTASTSITISKKDPDKFVRIGIRPNCTTVSCAHILVQQSGTNSASCRWSMTRNAVAFAGGRYFQRSNDPQSGQFFRIYPAFDVLDSTADVTGDVTYVLTSSGEFSTSCSYSNLEVYAIEI